eukprot:3787114-Rhodomonas_salina.4
MTLSLSVHSRDGVYSHSAFPNCSLCRPLDPTGGIFPKAHTWYWSSCTKFLVLSSRVVARMAVSSRGRASLRTIGTELSDSRVLDDPHHWYPGTCSSNRYCQGHRNSYCAGWLTDVLSCARDCYKIGTVQCHSHVIAETDARDEAWRCNLPLNGLGRKWVRVSRLPLDSGNSLWGTAIPAFQSSTTVPGVPGYGYPGTRVPARHMQTQERVQPEVRMDVPLPLPVHVTCTLTAANLIRVPEYTGSRMIFLGSGYAAWLGAPYTAGNAVVGTDSSILSDQVLGTD